MSIALFFGLWLLMWVCAPYGRDKKEGMANFFFLMVLAPLASALIAASLT